MKKLFISLFLWVATGFVASAQTVSTDPVTVTQSAEGIVITYHADGGNRGLMGLGANAQVYAHTGVITSASTSTSDWKHASSWGDNNAKYRMTYAGTDTWTLTIPSINAYYGITDPTEKVRELMFVFRTADNSREGKSAWGGDVAVTVFPDGFPSSTAATYPGGKPRMGAVENADGSVTFCLCAPSKTNVVMSASWNSFTPGAADVMNYQDYEGYRYFWTTVKGLEKGKNHTYYYIVDGASQIGDPYARLVLDPNNDKYIPSSVFPDMPAYPSQAVAGVPVAVYNSAMDDYDWTVRDFKGVPQSDLIIYELLLRDFTGTEGKNLGNGTVRGAIEKLDYLKDLGVNAIELLPIMEFAGNNSWGYNTNFYMAPDKAYGTPDDYRELIDGAHRRGMAVILDIVFNQSDAMHPWYGLYTRRNTPFYNGSAPHAYSVLNDWNQDCPLVQQQWHDALEYWMTAYNVDGFRFDLVKGLGDNSSYGTRYYPETNTYATPDDNGTNRYNATRVARMKALHESMRRTRPDAYFINENLAGAEEENQMAEDGETNWANINHPACQYAMGYESESSLNRFYAPLDQRLWGSTVSYAESHDEERVAYKVKTYGNTGVKGNLNAQMLRLGSLAAQMILTPGAHMIWQFEEMGNDQTTKAPDGGNDTSPKRVNWNMLKSAAREGLHDTYADLCRIRADYAPMFAEDVNTSVDLSSWTARTVALTKGEAELYLIVNPAVGGTATIAAPVNLTDGKYRLLAASHDTTPVPTASGVTLPGGAFAVYGANLPESGMTDIVADSRKAPSVRVEGGMISVLSAHDTVVIYNTAGMAMPADTPLTPGIYIVSVDNIPVKVAVK